MKTMTKRAHLGVVSATPESALTAAPFPAFHVVQGAGSQAHFIGVLRELPVLGFSIEELGWEPALRSPLAMKLSGVKDASWHLEPDELEP